MFCGECGHRWAPDEVANARFCAECGAPREDLPAAPAPAPALALAPAPVFTSPTPAPAPLSTPGVCTQCAIPFEDPTAAFCGECGHPRPRPQAQAHANVNANANANTTAQAPPPPYQPAAVTAAPASWAAPAVSPPATVVEDDDDGDLFGAASSTYTAPSPPAATPAYTSSPPPSAANTGSFSSFSTTPASPGVSVGYNPSHITPLASPPPAVHPTPAPPPPSEPTTTESPPASVTLNAGGPVNQISSLLANLSITKSDANGGERQEPDGSGDGISIRSVIRTRNMDSLSTRLAISQAVERNRAQPMEQVEGYNVTKVDDTITVAHHARVGVEEDHYYDSRTLPDDNREWMQILRRHRQSSTKFTDPQFPPDATSLFRDVNNKQFPHLEEYIWKWKRISDFFQEIAYVEITMVDDDKKHVCSIAMKSAAEAESILKVIRESPNQGIDPSFFTIAKDAVTTGVTKRRRDHLMLCTKNMIAHLSEYVQDGMQRFELLWGKSLLEYYKPLAFSGVGDGAGYRVDGSNMGVVSRVSVLVPVHFQAQGTCVFDRSRGNGDADRVSGVGVESGDLQLGRLADAYLFGAMSILSTSPNALAQVFPLLEERDLVLPDRVEVGSPYPNEQQYNDEGVYAVRFWRNNRSRVVVVDDYIPCSQYGKPVFGSFTGSNGKFEIWSVLVEKAYAKLHGGYEAIVGGQDAYALQDLYGGVPATYKLQETCPTEEQAWQTLSSTMQSGSLVGCTNDSVETEMPRGLKKSATYGIMRLAEIDYHGERVRVIQLRNSWGTGTLQHPEKWSGSWSSTDSKWHAFSRVQKVSCGFQFREDATYWMDFSAFFCFFTTIIESRNLYNFRSVSDGMSNPVSPSLSVHIITNEWNGITCGGREAMHLNPQYQVVSPASGGCQLTVHLEQPSRRMKMQTEYGAYIAPMVFRHGDRGQRKIDLAQDVIATGTFISNRSCLVQTSLEHDDTSSRPFVVIPATYDANLPAPLGFSLTLFTSKPTSLLPISDSATLPICCVCQKALSGSFRTFTHSQGDGPANGVPAQVDRVCNDCVDTYRERSTTVCVHCQERIEMVDGRFSGRMYTLPDGVSVHAECIDAYRIRTADKCVHCGHAVTTIAGRFDGKYFEVTGGKCHSECMEAFQMSTAKRCQHCREPVIKIAGRFDGRFYKLAANEEVVHFECWDAYQVAISPKCVHCTEPVMQIPGKFDGRFYDLTTGLGKVHFECWEAYQAAVLRR